MWVFRETVQMRGQKKQQKLEFLHLNLNLNLNSNNWENEDHIRDHPSVSFFLLLLWMGKWDFLGMGFGDGLKDNLSLLFLLCFVFAYLVLLVLFGSLWFSWVLLVLLVLFVSILLTPSLSFHFLLLLNCLHLSLSHSSSSPPSSPSSLGFSQFSRFVF